METKTAVFVWEKETKNTHRYAEQPADGQAPICGTIYVKRWALGTPRPDKIRLTIEPVD